jgi:ribosomal protein L16 Arg81 hydroxylase
MAIKHSKYRNTGILFELLVRQTTSDLINNQDSKAVKILKKYFTNTELGKEYSLYSTFSASPKLSEAKAEILISTIIEQYKKLDHAKIAKLKYNLIKEIKKNYDLDNFFKAKIENYKPFASIYTIFEGHNSPSVDTKQLILNKITLLEHLTKTQQVILRLQSL